MVVARAQADKLLGSVKQQIARAEQTYRLTRVMRNFALVPFGSCLESARGHEMASGAPTGRGPTGGISFSGICFKNNQKMILRLLKPLANRASISPQANSFGVAALPTHVSIGTNVYY